MKATGETLKCPTCKRDVGIVETATGRRLVAIHGKKPGGPVACPSGLLSVALVTGGRIK